IAVAQGLHPRPAFGILEHQHLVAGKHLRVEARVRSRGRAEVDHRAGDPHLAALDETTGFDLLSQSRVREIRPESMEPAIERAHIGSSSAWSMTISPRRSTN